MKKKLSIYWKNSVAIFCYTCILLYAFIFNNPSGWFLVYFMTTILILSFVSLTMPVKKIELNFKDDIFYQRGVENELEIALLKRWSILGLGTRLEIFPNCYKDSFLTNRIRLVSTAKKETVCLEWLPMERGIYDDLSIRLITSDYFKLFSKMKTLKLETALYVLPKENKRMSEKIYTSIFELNQLETRQLTTEVKKYRTYQEGDSWRFIDWKISAKNQEVIIKEFEVEKETVFHLIFLGSTGLHFEKMLSCYYTFQRELAKKIEFDQTMIINEGCYFNYNSKEIFAWLTPYKEIPKEHSEMATIKEKIILVFLTTEEEEIPENIRQLDAQNLVYYIRFQNNELMIRKN